MSRIRSIKPDLWTHGAFTECSLNARLLFIGSLNFCDDYGNFDRSANQLKSRVFPCDNLDCEALILDLIAHGRLIEYSVNGEKYLHIHKFLDHQVINRPGKPQFPAFDNSLRTPGVISESSVNIHGAISESSVKTHGGMEGNGREGSRRKTPNTPKIDELKMLIELGVPEVAASDWLKLRKSKRAPVTQSVLEGIAREAEKAKITFGQAITIAAERSWQSFKASWLEKDSGEKKPSREYDPSRLII